MATGIYSWSQTAATNSTADSTINWAEGQAPPTVNDSSRAEMAVLARWRDDISGVQPSNVVQTSAGTANAQTLTTNLSIAALTNGWTLTFKAGATNTAACTLAVDGLTAKNIQRVSGTNLTGGEIFTGCVYTVTYHQPADTWVLHDAPRMAGMELLTGGSASGANLSLVLTSYTGYRGLKFFLYDFIPATDDTDLYIRFSTDGGATYDATGYNYVLLGRDDSATATSGQSGSANQIVVNGVGIGNGATEGISLEANLLGQTNTATWNRIFGTAYMIDSSGTPNGNIVTFGGARETAQDTDAIRFLFSSGNITSGSYTVYGLR